MKYKKLELDKILNILQDFCVCDDTKQNIFSKPLCHDIEDVSEMLLEVTAAKDMIAKQGAPSFYDITNIENSLKRVELSGVLNEKELLEVASVLKTARSLSTYHEEIEDRIFILDKYFSLLNGDTRLENSIFNAISSEDGLFDTASHELFEIRKDIRSLNAKTREYLNKIVSKEQRFLQENLITIRNDRFVIPVKTEHKGDVSGLIHDVSSSGSTLFIEPQEVVSANNELKILYQKEKQEIERILKMFSEDIKNIANTIRLEYKIIIDLDFIFAKAKLSFKQNACAPRLNLDGYTSLVTAFHPLLDRKIAVPINISVGGEFDTLIITGPNTGGKTVALKTIGLLTLMTCLGMHIPASDQSEVYIGGNVYADIGDEQSIGESLSTFSSHISNIIKILSKAQKGDLVLFDELGSGTDPLEGSALAISIIEYARKFGVNVIATTHYSDIKLYALTTDGVINASFEFDMENLTPTYNLILGHAGKSNAFSISKRLGLDESIIENARSLLSSEHNRFEDALENLENDQKNAEKYRKEAENMRALAKKTLESAEKRIAETEQKYAQVVEKAKLQAERMLTDARRASQAAFSEIEELKKSAKEDIKSANISKARSEINKGLSDVELVNLARKNVKTPSAGDIIIGTQVRILKTNTIATAIELPDRDGKLVLKAGILKINAKLSDVELVSNSKTSQTKRSAPKPSRELRNSPIKRELDIRGTDTLEGISELEVFISSAIMSNLEEAYIIHGKGTGVLKNAVREHLRSHKHIKSFRPGRYGEGEDGVTVVTFK